MNNLSNLLSVVVVSYNSSSTVLETLSSILTQTYSQENIELIICDDGSSDSTCEIVDEWLKTNAHRFKRAFLLTSDSNQGISVNINRGWRAATGKWVKAIAADDLLLPDCLTDNLNFASVHPEVRIVFSDLLLLNSSTMSSRSEVKSHRPEFFSLNAAEQFESLCYENSLMAPSAFISKHLLEEVGYADERFTMLEDYPLWLKISKRGIKLFYLPAVTVAYRVSESLSNNTLKIANISYIKSLYQFKRLCVWPLWKKTDMFRQYDELFEFYEMTCLIDMFKNKRTKAYYLVHYGLFVFRPYKVFKILEGFFENRHDK